MKNNIKQVFITKPFGLEFKLTTNLVVQAILNAKAVPVSLEQEAVAGSITEVLYRVIEDSDLLICDITHRDPNVMYELGFAHALRKPVILIAQKAEIVAFDIRSVHTLYYETDASYAQQFVRSLESLIKEALDNPDRFSARPRTDLAVNSVFISYSHKDSNFLDRLRIHLRPLEKKGLIDLWDDTRLEAGQQWKASIEEALKRARVAILLVSADFLASDFIVDNELPPLFLKAQADGVHIIPLILKPCRFERDEILSHFQAINAPSAPLITLSEGDQEMIYDKISKLVERLFVGP